MHTIIKKPKHLQMKNSIGGAILIRLLSDLYTRFVKDLQKVKPKLKERKTKQHDPISYQFQTSEYRC